MGLMDEARQAQEEARVRRCPIYHVRKSLTPAERTELDEMMASDEFRNVDIAAVLVKRDPRCGEAPVGRHRKGLCACAR